MVVILFASFLTPILKHSSSLLYSLMLVWLALGNESQYGVFKPFSAVFLVKQFFLFFYFQNGGRLVILSQRHSSRDSKLTRVAGSLFSRQVTLKSILVYEIRLSFYFLHFVIFALNCFRIQKNFLYFVASFYVLDFNLKT